jgi:hypothetical protein
MTTDAYLQCLDDALLLVADGKISGFVAFMEQQQSAAEAKLSKFVQPLPRQLTCCAVNALIWKLKAV